MKKFDVTYSYEAQGSNGFGEVEILRMGQTHTVEAETKEEAEAIYKRKYSDKKDLRVNACER